MNVAVATLRRRRLPSRAKLLIWGASVAVLIGLWMAAAQWTAQLPWLAAYPDRWVVPLQAWIGALLDWLVHDATFGLFTFIELTRGIAWVIGLPLRAFTHLLSTGLSWPWAGPLAPTLPPLSWAGVILASAFGAWRLNDRKLALLMLFGLGYIVVFGLWDSAMVTLASILVGVPIGVVLGLGLGIVGYSNARFARALTPALDLMQTVPTFAYLIPVLFLFGFGPVSAMVATIIYATPPMARIAMLALNSAPPEIVEYGHMAGCSQRQMMWRILLPASRSSLMVGVNQVIMLSLNMVIIASMIGAGGLGYDVLHALQSLHIGDGLEAGLAITMLAICLDRLSKTLANRQAIPMRLHRQHGFVARHVTALGIIGILVLTWLLGFVVPMLQEYPRALVIDTSRFWSDLMRWININLFAYIHAVKAWLLIQLLVPFKRLLLDAPWPAVVAILGVAGWRLAGWRLAALVSSLALFIVVTGFWEKAVVSVYLCSIGVVLACAIGIPLGIWAAGSDRVHRVTETVADTLQTLPSFVYLIPIVMLFQVGSFSAIIAITAYAVAPAIRYTDHGIRLVPHDVIESATMSGGRPGQILWRVRLPLALPEVMLGVNQTIMMALSMLIITALVGTSDLGQEIYIALSQLDTGRGIVAGVGIAFIAIIADRLIGAWADTRKREFGIEY